MIEVTFRIESLDYTDKLDSQLPLSALYGGDNPKTESGIFIYLDFYHIYNIINKQALTVFLIFNHKKLKFLHNKTRVFP